MARARMRTRRLDAIAARAVAAEQQWASHAWSGYEVCQSFAFLKGYRTRNGGLDTYRAGEVSLLCVPTSHCCTTALTGNEILRETLDGHILLFFEPPVHSAVTPKQAEGETSAVTIGEGQKESSS